VADGPPPLATFTYDAAGNRLSRSLENGITSTYAYDNDGQLTSLSHGASVETLTYTYDAMHRRTGEARSSAPARAFGYDPTGQLTAVNQSTGNATFAYDAVGNRNTVTGAPGAGTYTANNLNQYTTAGGVGALTYDANGNLATGGGWTYTHNGNNRLVGVSGPATASIGRDGRNRDVKRTINGVTTYLIYDGWNLVAEYNGAGVLTTQYIHGPQVDEILAKATPTSTTFPLPDALGSTIAVTDQSGALMERVYYSDAFGTPTFKNGSGATLAGTTTGTRFLFTGREWLSQCGIYDYRNRAYSAQIGRFLETDPIRFAAGDGNLYRYVSNNPVNLWDPLGLWTVGGRINVSGPGFDVSFGITIDGHGNVDFTTSRGPGFTGGLGATLGVTTTNADCVDELHGWGNSAGFSAGEVVSLENNAVWGDTYVGGDFGFGIGAGLPFSPQGARTYTHSINRY
jgi:RHS repeat-associated protein